MIAARRVGGPVYPELIKEIDRELTKVIEDFNRAMIFEGLANDTSKLSFSQSCRYIVDSHGFGVERLEQKLLFKRLMPVKMGYHRNLCCMDGTRQSLLNQIVDWVANDSCQENVPQRNVYWLYSSPGI